MWHLEQLNYMASHDLKEPLRNISSLTDLIKSRFDEAEKDEIFEYLAFISEGSRRMYHLIESLLDFFICKCGIKIIKIRCK